ncbi:hypothetical protein LLE49_10230 [Alicyclobacillus tolerans]|uniref:hypothetical protein n=1 Tax=Alicyclobacillus tolerans TaxID=90970 RepID=UPI001F36E774|nr:hypothetical protein [Alicyclobacillus tolerans]MCF8565090.1 hypothetical protein [Alicyclobacillus tolerans]
MKRSHCCHAAVDTVIQSDLSHLSDDDYDLKVPFRVCSNCGRILIHRTDYEPEDSALRVHHGTARTVSGL